MDLSRRRLFGIGAAAVGVAAAGPLLPSIFAPAHAALAINPAGGTIRAGDVVTVGAGLKVRLPNQYTVTA